MTLEDYIRQQEAKAKENYQAGKTDMTKAWQDTKAEGRDIRDDL